MKSNRATLLLVLLFAFTSVAMASTWYVNGASGSDSNTCTSPTSACKTIGQAISLASSGDSIRVAAALYTENLNVGISLKILGSGANTTVIDGGKANKVITISAGVNVALANLTIQNGFAEGIFSASGGGIYNAGRLTVTRCAVASNGILSHRLGAGGGGIFNSGTLTIDKSTISNNTASSLLSAASGGGIFNAGKLMIRNSTVNKNSVAGAPKAGSGIYNAGTVTISNGTVSGNSGSSEIYNNAGGSAVLQNSIVSTCSGIITSNGYNLSSGSSCKFSGPGDLNNTNPKLGPLQDNGGTTQTMALSSGSAAVDAGNPNGCRDDKGHLLTTDQRGQRRPDAEDTGGCDMGAYERQTD